MFAISIIIKTVEGKCDKHRQIAHFDIYTNNCKLLESSRSKAMGKTLRRLEVKIAMEKKLNSKFSIFTTTTMPLIIQPEDDFFLILIHQPAEK